MCFHSQPQWARDILSSCPVDIKSQSKPSLELITTGLTEIQMAYKAPIAPLIPRPGLLLVGHVASSINLLEHAIWSATTSQPEAPEDLEVFKRWSQEGGLSAAIEEVRIAKEGRNRMLANVNIVYGIGGIVTPSKL